MQEDLVGILHSTAWKEKHNFLYFSEIYEYFGMQSDNT